MSSLSQFFPGGSVPVGYAVLGPGDKLTPATDSNGQLYLTLNPTQAVRAASTATAQDWQSRNRKYMMIDPVRGTYTEASSVMYSNGSWMLRISQNTMQWSSDGTNWSNIVFDGSFPAPLKPTFTSVSGIVNTMVANIGSTYYLAGYCSSSSQFCIFSSADGLNWTYLTTVVTDANPTACFSSANGKLFLCTNYSSSTGKIYTSTDGITWAGVSVTSPDGTLNTFTNVMWNGSVYAVVSGASSSTTNRAFYSSDGYNWTASTTGAFAINTGAGNILLSVFNSLFLYVSYDNTNSSVYTSSNGSTWTASLTIGSSRPIRGLMASGTTAVAFGNNSGVYTSTNGTTWTSQTYGVASQSLQFGTWNSTNSLFYLGYGNVYRTSPDGVTWSTGANFPSAVNSNGYRGDGMVSLGSNVYAVGTLDIMKATSGNVTSYVYAPKVQNSGSFFNYGAKTLATNDAGTVMVMAGGDRGIVTYDISGTQHPCRITDTSASTAVTFGNGKFISVGSGGVVKYSTDGYTWTSGSGVSGNLCNVAYGNGLYVALQYGSATLFTSTDGATWTSRSGSISTGGSGGGVNFLQYADGFWAYYSNGNSSCATSADGTTWNTTSFSGSNFKLVKFGNTHFLQSLAASVANVSIVDRTTSVATYSANAKRSYPVYSPEFDQYLIYVYDNGAGSGDFMAYATLQGLKQVSWSGASQATVAPTGTISNWQAISQGTTSSLNSLALIVTVIPNGSGTVLAMSNSAQVIYTDGAHGNYTNPLSGPAFGFYSGTTAADLQNVWTSDGSLYSLSTNGTLYRNQLGYIYSNPSTTTNATTAQYRRVA